MDAKRERERERERKRERECEKNRKREREREWESMDSMLSHIPSDVFSKCCRILTKARKD